MTPATAPPHFSHPGQAGTLAAVGPGTPGEVVTLDNGPHGESSKKRGNTKEEDNDDDTMVVSNDNESLCLSDLSALVQNNYNEYFNISKENEQLKDELNTYKNLCSKQVGFGVHILSMPDFDIIYLTSGKRDSDLENKF